MTNKRTATEADDNEGFTSRKTGHAEDTGTRSQERAATRLGHEPVNADEMGNTEKGARAASDRSGGDAGFTSGGPADGPTGVTVSLPADAEGELVVISTENRAAAARYRKDNPSAKSNAEGWAGKRPDGGTESVIRAGGTSQFEIPPEGEIRIVARSRTDPSKSTPLAE